MKEKKGEREREEKERNREAESLGTLEREGNSFGEIILWLSRQSREPKTERIRALCQERGDDLYKSELSDAQRAKESKRGTEKRHVSMLRETQKEGARKKCGHSK